MSASLERLSRRLWSDRALRDEQPSTLSQLILDDEAAEFVDAVRAYGRGRRRVKLAALAGSMGEAVDGPLPEEAAAFLVTGVLALGAAGELEDRLLGLVVQGAFGLDDASQRLRDAALGGLENWPDFPDDGPPFPPLGEDCLAGILNAASRAGAFVQAGRSAPATVDVDANGITSLVPNEGSADDVAQIHGTFPPTQPAGRIVLFPRADGGTLAAQLTGTGWGPSVITVIVPEPPGDGPVGFATSSSEGGPDPSALIDFADQVSACLGPRAAGIAGRLSNVAPGTILTPRQPVPVLPGGVNIFHGGPVLSSVSALSGSEPAPPFTVTGLNLHNGDAVYLEGTRCTTTFVNATTLTFRVPAIASGHKLLQIGRGYHRSNGTSFDVRATLDTTPTFRRVPPDTYVTLSGTGFGSSTTATVEGVAADSHVIDTHTIQVRVARPPRAPLPTEKRGERVMVEVFDRFASLGSVPVLVAAFRIAAFGDSIVWGQGLLPAQRFSTLVAPVISARMNRRIAVYAADHCAHSGAVIVPPVGEPLNTKIPRLATDFSGECPNPAASVTGQVVAWPVRFPTELTEIDLVVIDGGINDVGVMTILDPLGSDSALAAATIASCGTAMSMLLSTVVATFPRARVVVTGYYPIVSQQSNVDFLLPMLGALGLLAGTISALVSFIPGVAPIGFGPIGAEIIRRWILDRLSSRSATFAATANAALASAVTTTAAANPTRRLALAVPQFGPANSIFAADAFIYGVTPALTAEDPVAALRMAACSADPITDIASIGHPNAKGAQAYADAIAAVLPAVGL